MPTRQYDLGAARAAVAPFITRTPLLFAADLTERLGRDVYLKLENMQVTGSFKIRGAANRIVALSNEERERGVVTCSSGNHGRAVAHVAGVLGMPATICVPDWVDPVKLQAMEEAGADVLLAGPTYDEAESKAEELERKAGLTFVHPFDDPWVIAGQGTLGMEILEQAPEVSEVLVPLSGGGLAGGVAYAVKASRPDTVITAVSAERAAVMLASLDAGRPIEMEEEETVASALSGGIGLQNRHTFELVRDHIDRHISVPERAIREAMAYALQRLHLVVEGGGAVGLAAALRGLWPPASGEGVTVIVVSGGNVDLERLLDVTSG